jgi:hypothetical protein
MKALALRRRDCIGRRGDEALRRLVVSEQRFDLSPQVLVADTGFVEEGRAFIGRALQRGVIETLNFFPSLGLHDHRDEQQIRLKRLEVYHSVEAPKIFFTGIAVPARRFRLPE